MSVWRPIACHSVSMRALHENVQSHVLPALKWSQHWAADAGILELRFRGSPVDGAAVADALVVQLEGSQEVVTGASVAEVECPSSRVIDDGGPSFSQVRVTAVHSLYRAYEVQSSRQCVPETECWLRGRIRHLVTGRASRGAGGAIVPISAHDSTVNSDGAHSTQVPRNTCGLCIAQSSHNRRAHPCRVRVAVQVCFTVAGLEPAMRYELVLPAGTTYSASNPGSSLRNEQRFPITGVLDFTSSFPRGDDGERLTDTSASSSLLELWFPHAFAPGTDAEDLRSVLTLQEIRRRGVGDVTPRDVDFTIAFQPDSTCDARQPLPADVMNLWHVLLAEQALGTH